MQSTGPLGAQSVPLALNRAPFAVRCDDNACLDSNEIPDVEHFTSFETLIQWFLRNRGPARLTPKEVYERRGRKYLTKTMTSTKGKMSNVLINLYLVVLHTAKNMIAGTLDARLQQAAQTWDRKRDGTSMAKFYRSKLIDKRGKYHDDWKRQTKERQHETPATHPAGAATV